MTNAYQERPSNIVLPTDHDFNSSLDPFQLDLAYWKKSWYTPR